MGYQALLSASERHALRCDRGRIVQVKKTGLALYDQQTVRNNGQTSYLRLKTSAKLHIDQMMENSKLQSPERSCGKEISHSESKRKESQRRGTSESVFSGRHIGNVPMETDVVPIMNFQPLETRAKANKNLGKKGSIARFHPKVCAL